MLQPLYLSSAHTAVARQAPAGPVWAPEFHGRYVAFFASAAVACSHPGTLPHDMSAEGHEQAAREASAVTQETPCPPNTGETAQTIAVCWTPTVEGNARERAVEHERRLADAHQHAAAELLAQADAACAGVAESERNVSPFSHPGDIDGAKPLYGPHDSRKSFRVPIGVTIFVWPIPGLTQERLQRIVNCHLAENAVLGHVSPSEPDCPLVPAGVVATVRSSTDRFAVDVKGDSPSVVSEIRARTQRLVGNRWSE